MSIIDQLEREWQRLGRDPNPWAQLRGENLAEVAELMRSEPDGTLGALIGLAQRGDHLAGRVVVQALLPKLRMLAGVDRQAEAGDYVTHLWLRIMSYPLDRRARRVAANLALDTLKAVHAERGRERPHAEIVPGGAGPAEVEADAETLLRRAAWLGLVDDVSLATLQRVYVDGLSSAAAAEALATTPAAVRQRCSVAARRLAAHRLALAS